MSTQSNGFQPITFSITQPFQPVRLMEVPDDLLKYITSSNTPPSIQTSDLKSMGDSITNKTLKFKSAPPATSTSSSVTHSKDGILHLCTDDKAWAVKQVSTSNSVFLVRPSSSLPSKAMAADTDGDTHMLDESTEDRIEQVEADELQTQRAVSATSQINSFLELHPVKINIMEVVNAVLDLLPIYHYEDDARDMYSRDRVLEIWSGAVPERELQFWNQNDFKPPRTIEELINDIPFPDSIIKKACGALCVFEVPHPFTISSTVDPRTPKRAFIPSAKLLLDTWHELINRCMSNHFHLDDGCFNLDDLIEEQFVWDEENEEEEIHRSIVSVMFHADNGILAQAGTLKEIPTTESTNDFPNLKEFKPVELCRFIGELILSAQLPVSSFSSSSSSSSSSALTSSTTSTMVTTTTTTTKMEVQPFKDKWFDLVPFKFDKYINLNILVPDDTTATTTAAAAAATTTPPSSSSHIKLDTDDKDEEEGGGGGKQMLKWTGHSVGNGLVLGISLIGGVYDVAKVMDKAGSGVRSGTGNDGSNIGGGGGGAEGSAEGKPAVAAVAGVGVDKKRKWHEMFGAQRNVK